METKDLKQSDQVIKKPLVLLIAKQVEELQVSGNYSLETETWSDRKYEFSGDKKHNEDM